MDQFFIITLFITRWIFILFVIAAFCGGAFAAVRILTDHPQEKSITKPNAKSK